MSVMPNSWGTFLEIGGCPLGTYRAANRSPACENFHDGPILRLRAKYLNRQLQRRRDGPDLSLDAGALNLEEHCTTLQLESQVHWKAPAEVLPIALQGEHGLKLTGGYGDSLNDWSFRQACTLAGVNKETINRLKTETAVQVLLETMPVGAKPIQTLTRGYKVRSIHGASYSQARRTRATSDYSTGLATSQT